MCGCGRDTIGLLVDFPARELVFFKNSHRQGQCNFADNVKALYLVTSASRCDQVELRPAGLSASMRGLRLQDSPRWGDKHKGNPGWLTQMIKDSTKTAVAGGSARAGIGVALVLVESIQAAVSLSSEQVSEILDALTACFFLSGVAKGPTQPGLAATSDAKGAQYTNSALSGRLKTSIKVIYKIYIYRRNASSIGDMAHL